MITPQLTLGLHNEIFIDNFAGGGGASTGIERAIRRAVDAALNHDRKALAMHRMNHPTTKHYPEDIRHADPLKIAGSRPVGGIWFSPDCKHFSKAKGGKPRSKFIRGLAWSVVHWVNVLKSRPVGGAPRVIYLENVEEFQTWCPLMPDGQPSRWRAGWFFQCFIGALRRRGYAVESREMRASNHGAPTIRRRLFLIARCDGRPIVWPEQTHAAPDSAAVKEKKLKPYRTIAECLDFSLPCPSIFLSKADARKVRAIRPLAAATLARIAKGVDRYVLKANKPFIVELTHEGNAGVASVGDPLKTITAANRGEKGLVAPVLAVNTTGHASAAVTGPAPTIATGGHQILVESTLAPFMTEHANGSHQRNFSADEPMRTLCAQVKGGHFAAVSPYLVPRYGERNGQEPRTMPVNAPGPAVVPTGNGGSLAAVHLTKFRAGATGSAADEPCPTVTANSFIKRAGGAAPLGVVAASVVKMRGDPTSHAPGHPVDEPGHTISAQGTHHSLVAAYVAQHNGGANGHQTVGHPADGPTSTISSKGCQQQLVGASLVPYYGSEEDSVGVKEPGRTVTTRDRFGLTECFGVVPPLTPELEASARVVAAFLRQHGIQFDGEFATVGEFVIVDIGMRMLKPRELYNAQSFPLNYIIDRGLDENEETGRFFEIALTGTDQVRMCGNSVCPIMAEVIVGANNPEMRVEEAAA